jgi:putative transposase
MEIQQLKDSRYTKNAGAVFNLSYHIVFCPKYRLKVLVGEVEQRLKHVLYATAQQYGVLIETMEVMPDHVHLFVTSDPTRCVAEIVNRLKAASSRILRQEFPHLVSRMPTLWSRSYYAGAVGHVSESTVKKYIENQKGR